MLKTFKTLSISILLILSLLVTPIAVQDTGAAAKVKVSAPTGVKAVAASASSVKLTWNKVSNAKGYVVYRFSSTKGEYVALATIAATSYTNTGLTTGTAYNYKLRSYTLSGKTKVYSSYTASVSITLKSPTLTVGQIAKQYGPAVVLIKNKDKSGKVTATGSGFVISSDGKIVTNYHVIAFASSLEITMIDGNKFTCKTVLGYDIKRDLAVIKVTAANLPTLSLGDSSKVVVGDSVVAIGNPLGLQNVTSTGIISSIPKSVRNITGKDLQLTAAVSPGSSGGPLFNMLGQVIGITYASYTEGQNLNLAIPVNELKALATDDSSTFQEILDKEYKLSYLPHSKIPAPNGYTYSRYEMDNSDPEAAAIMYYYSELDMEQYVAYLGYLGYEYFGDDDVSGSGSMGYYINWEKQYFVIVFQTGNDYVLAGQYY